MLGWTSCRTGPAAGSSIPADRPQASSRAPAYAAAATPAQSTMPAENRGPARIPPARSGIPPAASAGASSVRRVATLVPNAGYRIRASVPIQTCPGIAQGKPVRMLPRSHSAAATAAANATAKANPFPRAIHRAARNADAQNRPNPTGTSTTANGSAQRWLSALTRKGYTIQWRAIAKCAPPAIQPAKNAPRGPADVRRAKNANATPGRGECRPGDRIQRTGTRMGQAQAALRPQAPAGGRSA